MTIRCDKNPFLSPKYRCEKKHVSEIQTSITIKYHKFRRISAEKYQSARHILKRSDNLILVDSFVPFGTWCPTAWSYVSQFCSILIGVVHILRNHFWGSWETPPPHVIRLWRVPATRPDPNFYFATRTRPELLLKSSEFRVFPNRLFPSRLLQIF